MGASKRHLWSHAHGSQQSRDEESSLPLPCDGKDSFYSNCSPEMTSNRLSASVACAFPSDVTGFVSGRSRRSHGSQVGAASFLTCRTEFPTGSTSSRQVGPLEARVPPLPAAGWPSALSDTLPGAPSRHPDCCPCLRPVSARWTWMRCR